MRKIFLTAEWRKLILVNYLIDPGKLLPYLPYKTELDLWKDRCYISLVGFRFINTRLKGFSLPFHRDFEEINLRFYVRYKDGNEWKRGVSFIKEIVPKPALTLVANRIYSENYVTLPTKHKCGQEDGLLKVMYGWKHQGEWDSIEVAAKTGLLDIEPGSEEEFITEHYWGYTPINSRLSSEYKVEHPRWQTYPVVDHQIKVRFGALYGAEFGMLKDLLPQSIMLAEGSLISVRSASRIN
ncbi:MAG: YqjF family protein [Flavisolibacter sp.]